jgi:hypothetical protein
LYIRGDGDSLKNVVSAEQRQYNTSGIVQVISGLATLDAYPGPSIVRAVYMHCSGIDQAMFLELSVGIQALFRHCSDVIQCDSASFRLCSRIIK